MQGWSGEFMEHASTEFTKCQQKSRVPFWENDRKLRFRKIERTLFREGGQTHALQNRKHESPRGRRRR